MSLLTSAATRRVGLSGCVADGAGKGRLVYQANVDPEMELRECEQGTREEWLMERYTAFTCAAGKARFFRVWHRPWLQLLATVAVSDQSLLESNWSFFRGARPTGANFSPGLRGVWMGRPHRLDKRRTSAPTTVCGRTKDSDHG